MKFIKIDSEGNVVKYPYTIADFIFENPFTKPSNGNLSVIYQGTEDQVSNKYDVLLVEEDPRPDYDSITQTLQKDEPKYIDGKFVVKYIITSKAQSEIDEYYKNLNLSIRNSLLKGSDWTQVQDSPLTDSQKLDYQSYRQQLRDITKKPSFPILQDSDWPVDMHGFIKQGSGA